MSAAIDDRLFRHVRLQELRAENHAGDVSAIDIAWLIAEVDRLAATLEWYADDKNHKRRAEGTFATLVGADGGARARNALRMQR